MRAAEKSANSIPWLARRVLAISGLAAVSGVWLGGNDFPTALAFLSIAAVCLLLFFRLGGVNLVPSAVFFYSLGLLAGVAGLLALATGFPSDGGLAEVGFMLLLVSLGGVILALRSSKTLLVSRGSPWRAGDVAWNDIQWLRALGVAMLVAAVAALPVRALGPIGSAFAYLGVLCVVLSAALAADKSHRVALTSYLAFVALAGVAYLVVAFSGFGRIVVAELGLAALICLGFVRAARWPKLVLTLGVIPVAIVGGLVGQVRSSGEGFSLSQIQGASVAPVLEAGAGLTSVYSPLVDSARLVEMDRRGTTVVPLEYGLTAQDLVLTIVPRAIWADKPVQLGRTIVEVLQPQYADIGHSLAVGLWGEGFINFRYVGFVVYPLMAAWLALKADFVVPRLLRMGDARSRLILLVAVASTTSSIPDLLWGGIGTFAARGGTRLVILLAVAGLLAKARSREPIRVAGDASGVWPTGS